MARLTDDAGETSGNVPRPRSYSENDHAYYGLRTRCVTLSLSTNVVKLRRQGQSTSMKIIVWLSEIWLSMCPHSRSRLRHIRSDDAHVSAW
ncbi:unnamed protein product [Protopolystoma xenopodis]|uniref:Uncharacterized protein n=1 Tax=Protopolystoma xenopodis TaxID=117903 RepID=A0A3S5AHP6_9PLAT|nr:unnamed protein product [Protopolystoma xenopodis]